MNQELNFGSMTEHAVGRVLKEAVRRATVIIRNERMKFEAFGKESYTGSMDDVFTTADTKAQEIYLRTLQECFPDCGIIAEEDKLFVESKNGMYFTIDPLDGTKAFVRRQSHGVGTMIALVYRGKVVSAYIGDINTGEVYGYRPGSDKVHRITQLDIFETMQADVREPFQRRYVLLRDPPERYASATRRLIADFRNYEVSGGSIGIWAARLWKGEVGALLLPPGHETPWDSTPIIGISQKLGFAFLRPAEDQHGKVWESYLPSLPTQVEKREHDLLIIHDTYIANLGGAGYVVNHTPGKDPAKAA